MPRWRQNHKFQMFLCDRVVSVIAEQPSSLSASPSSVDSQTLYMLAAIQNNTFEFKCANNLYVGENVWTDSQNVTTYSRDSISVFGQNAFGRRWNLFTVDDTQASNGATKMVHPEAEKLDEKKYFNFKFIEFFMCEWLDRRYLRASTRDVWSHCTIVVCVCVTL